VGEYSIEGQHTRWRGTARDLSQREGRSADRGPREGSTCGCMWRRSARAQVQRASRSRRVMTRVAPARPYTTHVTAVRTSDARAVACRDTRCGTAGSRAGPPLLHATCAGRGPQRSRYGMQGVARQPWLRRGTAPQRCRAHHTPRGASPAHVHPSFSTSDTSRHTRRPGAPQGYPRA
jgi:hypothetical protein